MYGAETGRRGGGGYSGQLAKEKRKNRSYGREYSIKDVFYRWLLYSEVRANQYIFLMTCW